MATDAGRFTPSFGRGARLAGRTDLFGELRILLRTEGNIGAETAVSQNHGLAGANELHLAGIGVRELVTFADLHALDAAVGVTDDLFHEDAGTGLDAEFLELGDFLVDDFGAGTGLQNGAAGNGVTAFLRNAFLNPIDTEFFDGPFPSRKGFTAEMKNLVRVVEAGAFADHVFRHQFGRVLVPLLLLHRSARNAHDSAVDDGISADGAHLFEHANGSTGLTGFDGGGETGKTRADHDDVESFVPLLGHGFEGGCVSGGQGSRKQGRSGRGRLEQMSTRKIGHNNSPLSYLGLVGGTPDYRPSSILHTVRRQPFCK